MDWSNSASYRPWSEMATLIRTRWPRCRARTGCTRISQWPNPIFPRYQSGYRLAPSVGRLTDWPFISMPDRRCLAQYRGTEGSLRAVRCRMGAPGAGRQLARTGFEPPARHGASPSHHRANGRPTLHPERTLKRQLQREGCTFKSLQDAAWLRAANSMLSDPALAIADIAQRIGFDDPPISPGLQALDREAPSVVPQRPAQLQPSSLRTLASHAN